MLKKWGVIVRVCILLLGGGILKRCSVLGSSCGDGPAGQ
jgi:hypothetical protein